MSTVAKRSFEGIHFFFVTDFCSFHPPWLVIGSYECKMGRLRQLYMSSNISRALILLGFIAATRTGAFLLDPYAAVAKTNHAHPARTSTQLSADTGTFLRWRATSGPNGRVWDMQTAVATFEKENRTLYLHAMIHYASQEYFEYYNGIKSTVLYELLVDESLLEKQEKGLRRLKPEADIQATPADRSVAAQYGWSCQADSIRYDHRWIHADLSTQEFLKQLPKRNNQQSSLPLWKVATTERFPTPALEAATALAVGPPFLATRHARRRLFSNLFVPGSTVANILRALLWFTVPSPELSVLLLDWSSLTAMSISQITLPLVETIAKGQFASARQLLFGQVAMLASKANRYANSQSDLLVSQRNQRAMQVLRSLDESTPKLSLLYGCNHCPDLLRRLVKDGYELTAIEWRTAWSVRLADETNDLGKDSSETATVSAVFLVGLPLYLAIGAFDWISTWSDIIQTHDFVDLVVMSSFYLLRHAVMYSVLSKYVLEWEDQSTNAAIE
jgi:hypothetical protein